MPESELTGSCSNRAWILENILFSWPLASRWHQPEPAGDKEPEAQLRGVSTISACPNRCSVGRSYASIVLTRPAGVRAGFLGPRGGDASHFAASVGAVYAWRFSRRTT